MKDKMSLKSFLVLLCCSYVAFGDEWKTSCPPSQSIDPCTCDHEETHSDSNELIVSCRGLQSLPKLTKILRTQLCSYKIAKFRLVASDIGYLPSNLFSKVLVRDIFVSFTNINHFTEAGRSAFYGLEEGLGTLTMRRCALVDQLKWEKIGDLQRLTSLDLSENTLTEIPQQWFRHPPRNLRLLYLRGNKIDHISSTALSSMHKLTVLDLSENLITTLERSMFPMPANSLSILTLSYNRLQSLPSDIFNEMFGLKRLYLDHNLFETLEEEAFAPIWSELTVLDVLGNRINCTCSMRWISLLYRIENMYGFCVAPQSLDGKELKSLYEWDFIC